MDEVIDLLSHVEVALDGANCDGELRRRVANLIQSKLTVDLIGDLNEIVQVVEAAQRCQNVPHKETVVEVVLRVIILFEHLEEHLGYLVSCHSIVAQVKCLLFGVSSNRAESVFFLVCSSSFLVTLGVQSC